MMKIRPKKCTYRENGQRCPNYAEWAIKTNDGKVDKPTCGADLRKVLIADESTVYYWNR